MARKAILTAQEIKDFSSATADTPNCNIIFIAQFEEKLLSDECFLGNLYEDLKADLVDYSGVLEYSNTLSYAIGDKVKSKGTFFVAKVGSVGVPPPSNLNWAVSEKFKSECFNKFFCDYLAYYISEYIVRQNATVDTSSSLFERFNTKSAFDTYMAGSNNLVKMAFENMVAYMKKTDCLKKYVVADVGECGCGEEKKEPNCFTKKSKMQFA